MSFSEAVRRFHSFSSFLCEYVICCSLLNFAFFDLCGFYLTGRDRTNYLLVKEAKIIAMTCTHAALKRRDLVELGFKVRRILPSCRSIGLTVEDSLKSNLFLQRM